MKPQIIINSKGESLELLEQFPFRIPIQIGDAISKYTIGKNVVDLGCGAGDLIYYIKHMGYCDDILGVEYQNSRYTQAYNNKRTNIINADIKKTIIPEKFTVYYIWIAGDALLDYVLNYIPSNSILIDGMDITLSPYSEPIQNILKTKYKLLETITYEYDETYSSLFNVKLIKQIERKVNKGPFVFKGTRNTYVYQKI